MIEGSSNEEIENAANNRQGKLIDKSKKKPITFLYKSTTKKQEKKASIQNTEKNDETENGIQNIAVETNGTRVFETKRHVVQALKSSIKTFFKKMVNRRHETTPTKTPTPVSDCTYIPPVEKQNHIKSAYISGYDFGFTSSSKTWSSFMSSSKPWSSFIASSKTWNSETGTQREETDFRGNKLEGHIIMKTTIRDDKHFFDNRVTQLIPVSKISIDRGKERNANCHAVPYSAASGTMKSFHKINDDTNDCNNYGVEKHTVIRFWTSAMRKEKAEQEVTEDATLNTKNDIIKYWESKTVQPRNSSSFKYDNSGSESASANFQMGKSLAEVSLVEEGMFTDGTNERKTVLPVRIESHKKSPDKEIIVLQKEEKSITLLPTEYMETESKAIRYLVLQNLLIWPHWSMVKTSDTSQIWLTKLYGETRSSVYKYNFSCLFFVQFRLTLLHWQYVVKKNVLFVNHWIMTEISSNRNIHPKISTMSLILPHNDDPGPSQSRLQTGILGTWKIIVQTLLEFDKKNVENALSKPSVLQEIGKKLDANHTALVRLEYGEGAVTESKRYGIQNGIQSDYKTSETRPLNENTHVPEQLKKVKLLDIELNVIITGIENGGPSLKNKAVPLERGIGRAFGGDRQSNDGNASWFHTARVLPATQSNIPTSSDQDRPSERLFSQSIISSPESDMNAESTQGGVIVERRWFIGQDRV